MRFLSKIKQDICYLKEGIEQIRFPLQHMKRNITPPPPLKKLLFGIRDESGSINIDLLNVNRLSRCPRQFFLPWAPLSSLKRPRGHNQYCRLLLIHQRESSEYLGYIEVQSSAERKG